MTNERSNTRKTTRTYIKIDTSLYDRRTVIVNYDATDSVIERIGRRGGRFQAAECVKVGKIARIVYWTPKKREYMRTDERSS